MPLPPHPLSDILVVRQYPKSNAYIKRPPGTHNSYILRVVGWDNHIRLVCMQRSAWKTTVEEQHIKSWGKSSFQSIFDRRRVALTVAEFLHDFPKVSLQVSSIVCGNCGPRPPAAWPSELNQIIDAPTILLSAYTSGWALRPWWQLRSYYGGRQLTPILRYLWQRCDGISIFI